MATFKQMVSNWLLGEYPVRTTQIVTTPTGDNGLIQHVRLTDDSGNYVSSSGGTQYVEGATEATPTGTVALGKDSSNILRTLEIDGSGNLNVNVAAGGAGDGAILDGANSAIKATVLDLASSNPLATAIVDATGAQISSFGGGTQYTQGDTSVAIVGTVAMMEVGSDTLQPVQGTVADGLLVNLGSNNDVTVSGVSTAAKQDTIIGHLDGVEALLTTIDADTGNIATSTASIDGKITACNTGAVVVSSSALPSGAATLAEQQTQTTSLQLIDDAIFAEDTASANLDKGINILAVRKASPANTSGTDGDYESLQMSAGRLWTSTTVTGSPAVTVSNATVEGADAVDAAIARNPVLISGYATGDPTNQVVSDEGDVQYIKTDLNGRVWVTADASAPVTTTIAGTAAVTQSGTWQVAGTIAHDSATTANPLMAGGYASAAAPTSVSADGDAVRQWMLRNGAAATVLTAAGALIGGDATNGLDVDVTRMTHGKTVLSAGGSASSSGNNTLIAAGSNRLKVSKFSLSTTSTTAMTCIFQSGAGGTELWRVILQAPTSVSTGANLAVPVPDWIFATASATLLNLNLSSANAVHWSVSYVDEA